MSSPQCYFSGVADGGRRHAGWGCPQACVVASAAVPDGVVTSGRHWPPLPRKGERPVLPEQAR
jgi:hypothetical protein